jgi:hypothetical protein
MSFSFLVDGLKWLIQLFVESIKIKIESIKKLR